MKLDRLELRRVPGIDPPFTLEGLAPGLNVLTGPNGAGKSSVRRALSALLWPESAPRGLQVAARFERGGETVQAELQDGRTRFEGATPVLPDASFATCLSVGVDDVLARDARTDAELARAFRRELAGGFDLEGVRAGFELRPQHGWREHDALRKLRRDARDVDDAQRALAEREDELALLADSLRDARRARAELPLIDAALQRAEATRQLAAVNARITELPAALQRLASDASERLGEREDEFAERRDEAHHAERALARCDARLTDLGDPADPVELVACEHRIGELSRAEQALADARQANARGAHSGRLVLLIGGLAFVALGVFAGLAVHLAGWALAVIGLAGIVAALWVSRGVDETEAVADAKDRHRGEVLARIVPFLDPDGSIGIDDAAGARAHVGALREGERERERLSDERAEKAEDVERRRSALAQAEARVVELYAGAEVERGDRAAFDRLLSRREEFVGLVAKRDVLTASVDAHAARLDQRQSMFARTPEELRAERERARDEAERYEDVLERSKTIESEIALARSGDAREGAHAAVAAAEDMLQTRLSDALDATAGALLLDEVGEEYERASKPEVLRRAEELFGAFTRYRLTLELGDAIAARETESGALRTLAQLSDGTRAQLLLAARLAWIEHGEGVEKLPLFLDDSLSLADDERFDEVARAVLEIAGERQVFYATARSGDVERWRRLAASSGAPTPRVHDVAVLRGRAAAAPGPALAAPPPRPDLSEFGAAEMADALAIPPPDPHRDSALHLLHVLWEAPDLFRTLFAAGFERLGPWLELRRGRTADAVVGDTASLARIDARIGATCATLAAWRVGRGRPLDGADLVECAAVSATFHERLASLVTELRGDARAFLEVLDAREDERTKGFLGSKRDELADWLGERGHHDPREPLERDDALRRVLEDAAPHLRDDVLDPGDVRLIVERLWLVLGRR